MKKKITGLNFFVIIFLTVFVNTKAWSNNEVSAQVYVNGGQVVVAWQAFDSFGNHFIQGATGSISSNPNTWTITNISPGVTTNQQPRLFSSLDGNVVVLWQYSDASAKFHVSAAALPSGGSSWVGMQQISSNSGETAGAYDEMASIDTLGNVIATWTSYDPIANHLHIKGATASFATPTFTWSAPINISP